MASIEFITIAKLRKTFHASYIGASSEGHHKFNQGETPIERLPEFLELITKNGFEKMAHTDDNEMFSYKRTGLYLPEGI